MAYKLLTEAKIHGVHVDSLVKLLTEQRGKCPICDRPLVELAAEGAPTEIEIGTYAATWTTPAKPHVDFCPNTGVIRGLLCHACSKLVAGESAPFKAMASLSKSKPRAQIKSAHLLNYFNAKPTNTNLISSRWEPDPMLRA